MGFQNSKKTETHQCDRGQDEWQFQQDKAETFANCTRNKFDVHFKLSKMQHQTRKEE